MLTRKPTTSRRLALLSLALVILLMGLIWLPEIQRYYVLPQRISAAAVESGRAQPSDSTLEEIRAYRLLPREWSSDAELTATAEKLLHGKAEVPGYAPMEIHLPFSPSDLDRGSSLWQLQFSELIVPEILLEAFRRTGREEFYSAARDVILAWAVFESSAWVNRGLLWNDHAIAARIRTLVDFWGIYRHRPDYRPDVARAVWSFVARSAELLAKPGRFTFATNHGVMQNLALWQVCIAFPSLPRAEEYKHLAFSRLMDQMAFYVGPDGVVLEHSAEYHEFGLYLFGVAMRYATLLNLEVPADWIGKYREAENFYALIRRPDGSLPMFGDTGDGRRPEGVPVAEVDAQGRAGRLTPGKNWKPRDPFGLYPLAGYAVFWDGIPSWPSPQDLSQTVLAWSNYPGHGHKHADEPSVLLWADGQAWWTNVGYWLYDDPDRPRAECWEGANAPHLLGEVCGGHRASNLVSFTHSPGLFAAEAERSGPGSLVIRRQAVHVSPSIWVLVDHCAGAPQRSVQTIWTVASNVRLDRGAVLGEYLLSADGVKSRLRAYFLGPSSMTVKDLRGSRDPFAGWVSARGKPHPTGAVVTEQPAEGAWAVTIWVLDDGAGDDGVSEALPPKLEWDDAQNWRVLVSHKLGVEEVSRRGDELSVLQAQEGRYIRTTSVLSKPPSVVSSQIATVRASFQAAAERYPRVRDLFPYRLRAAGAVLGFFALQELFFFVYLRVNGKHPIALRCLALLGWVGISVWVPLFYLRAG